MILELLKALILGIVEGITEFLPVSSTGHLIIINQWLSFDPSLTFLFDIFIQLGAILAVIVFFREKLFPFKKTSEEKKLVFNLWQKTLLAVIPAIIIGFFLKDIIEQKLFNPKVVSYALIIGGFILLIAEKINKKPDVELIEKITAKKALLIGLCQCLAMIPGVSRSGATIIGGLFFGLNRKISAEFSFFLAIPTMLLASSYSLLKAEVVFDMQTLLILATGFIFAFLSALLVIKIFVKYIQNHDFKIFGYYRIIVGVVILLLLT